MLLPILAAVFASSQWDATADWPRYLGPEGNGVGAWPAETFEWPEDGPSVCWRIDIGTGYGGVAVADGQVFLFDREKGERDVLRVIDIDSGEEVWSAGYEQKGRLNFDGSRTVPTIAGHLVFATSGFGRVACFDREAQALVWNVDLEADHGGVPPMFGWSAHPVVYGDTLIVTPLGPEIGLAALDVKDGSLRWKTGHVGYSHSTPVVAKFQGREQLLFNACPNSATGQDKAMPATVWSFDPTTGKTLWRHDLTLSRLPVPPPVVVDEERLFVTGGYRAGSVMLRFAEGDGAEPKITEAFRSTRGAQIHVPLLYEQHLYALVNENWTESRRNRAEGGLACFDLKGKEVWRTGGDPYFGRGGMVQVADALLIQDGFDGELAAVRATPKGYDEIGRFSAFDIRSRDGELWAPPAVYGTMVFLRSKEELVCIELMP